LPNIGPITFGSELREGQRVQVLCHVNQGDGPVKMRWFKEPHALSHPSHVKNVTYEVGSDAESGAMSTLLGATSQALDGFSMRLIISELARHHAGNYTCHAQNSVGYARRTAELVVSGKIACYFKTGGSHINKQDCC
jgi:hypothetical protein